MFKMGCQKLFTKLQKMKKTQSEIKPIKIGKRPGKMFCFGCKNFTHNFRLKKVNMTNKVLREKSHCVICWSNKSRFLKQKHNNKKKFYALQTHVINIKMKTYFVKCRKDTENIDPKMVRIKNNRLIMQANCPVCGIRKSRLVKE